MIMNPSEIRDVFVACMKDEEMISALRDIFTPIIDRAVSAAVKDKDEMIGRLEREIAEQRRTINDLEQYSRKNCINISGLPESTGENVISKVAELGAVVGVDICESDIDTAHRLGNPDKSKTRTVIVKFVRFDKREQLYAARKQIRTARIPSGSSLTAPVLRGVYVTDSLTRANQAVMYAAREMRRADRLFAAWTDSGRMKVRVKRDGPTRVIRSIDDLHELTGADPTRPGSRPAARSASARPDAADTRPDADTAPPGAAAAAAAADGPTLRASVRNKK